MVLGCSKGQVGPNRVAPELRPGSAPSGHVCSPTLTYGHQSPQHCRYIYVPHQPRQGSPLTTAPDGLRVPSGAGLLPRTRAQVGEESHASKPRDSCGRSRVCECSVNSRRCTGSSCFRPLGSPCPTEPPPGCVTLASPLLCLELSFHTVKEGFLWHPCPQLMKY